MQYHPDEPRAQARERVFGRMRSSGGDGRQSMLTALLAVSIFIGTGAFGFWQATSPPRVQDQIEIGIAELTDIDPEAGGLRGVLLDLVTSDAFLHAVPEPR